MSQRESIPNHTTNPLTGFIESNGYANAFDSDRKLAFLKLYRESGLRMKRTCIGLGLSIATIHTALRVDSRFKELFDDVERDYIDELEATSRDNALNPKMVIERIFQLKCLRPEKYDRQNSNNGSAQVIINIDGKLLDAARGRRDVLDVGELPSSSAQIAHMPQVTDDSATPDPGDAPPPKGHQPPKEA